MTARAALLRLSPAARKRIAELPFVLGRPALGPQNASLLVGDDYFRMVHSRWLGKAGAMVFDQDSSYIDSQAIH
jgi:hypothetical protein